MPLQCYMWDKSRAKRIQGGCSRNSGSNRLFAVAAYNNYEEFNLSDNCQLIENNILQIRKTISKVKQ